MAHEPPFTSLPQDLSHKGSVPPRTLEGQRRQATVLFADMAAFTPLAERLGEEKTYILIQQSAAGNKSSRSCARRHCSGAYR